MRWAVWRGGERRGGGRTGGLEGACAGGQPYRLMALAGDWRGEALSTLPYVAKLGDQARCMELRVLRRDQHLDVMDRYLTGSARSIPIVIVLDEDWHEIGHWGPRPAALQGWVMEARKTTPPAQLYPHLRRWYPRDRGETTLPEILPLLPPPSPPLPPPRRDH